MGTWRGDACLLGRALTYPWVVREGFWEREMADLRTEDWVRDNQMLNGEGEGWKRGSRGKTVTSVRIVTSIVFMMVYL